MTSHRSAISGMLGLEKANGINQSPQSSVRSLALGKTEKLVGRPQSALVDNSLPGLPDTVDKIKSQPPNIDLNKPVLDSRRSAIDKEKNKPNQAKY